jgi:hypothetical protein
MEPENLAVIDVESEPIDSTEPENDEIWYSAVQIQGLVRLSKAGLQQSISKLVSIYGLDIQTLYHFHKIMLQLVEIHFVI